MALPRLIRPPFRPHPPTTATDFSVWLRGPLGQDLVAAQQSLLQDILPRLPGLRALQCSVGTPLPLLQPSVQPLRWTLSVSEGADLRADPGQLPIPPQCLDLVVLHHSLDFEDDPHRVLAQVARTLQPGGALVVIGFQPISLWGVTRLLRLGSRRVPWLARFIRPQRISDWLQVLSCEVEGFESGFHELPLPVSGRRWTGWLSWLSARLWPQHGAFYVLVARKRAAMMRPVRPRFALPGRTPNVVAVPLARWQRRQRTDPDADV